MVIFASSEDALARKKICEDCSSRAVLLCTECGCLVSAKVRLNYASCPLNKWGTVEAKLNQPYDLEDIPNHERQA